MVQLENELDINQRNRLENELIIWLTTVNAEGMPQPTPVWFHWDGETFLIYSEPDKPKLHNIAANPIVALNLNSDHWGDDILIITGEARVDLDAPDAQHNSAYLEKYRKGIADLKMTPEGFAKDFRVPIRVTPIKTRNW